MLLSLSLLIAAQASAFAYPSESQAKLYCNSFRVALASSTGLFISMHLLAISCYFMFTQNANRDSLVHEDLDFDGAARDLQLAKESMDGGRPSNVAQQDSSMTNPLAK